MVVRWTVIVAIAVGLIVAGCGGDDDRRSAASGNRPELRVLLDDVRKAGSPGAAAIVRDASGTWRGATGAAVLKPRRPLRASDRFRVASITKTFVATVVLQLVDEGKLSLGDTVEEHLPGLLREGKRITIGQLLNHTSGLSSADDAPESEQPYQTFLSELRFDIPIREAVAWADRQPLHFPPGRGQRYTNTGYEVLGLIVDRVSGASLKSAFDQRIITPLDLTSTSYEPESFQADARMAHGYAIAGSDLPAASFSPQDVTEAGNFPSRRASGGMVSTVDDLATFYRALLQGKLLPQALLNDLLTTVATDDRRARAGFGIFRYQTKCGLAWGHGGATLGYTANVLASRDGSRLAIVAANAFSRTFADVVGQTTEKLYCRA